MKKIEILGSGCPKCKQTEKIMKIAVKDLEIDAKIEKVTDIDEIISRGVVATPAVAIDGKVVISGKIPTLEEAKELLNN
ncbi:redox-active disulfide protein 2 [Thermosipho melanesiensis]|uniref:Redox-active disulfide protein 2 n=2 Tax=Thermosipho melanesiensis TaxID=46541 RepID=A6LL87_THEM4|nr:thioredoxin family protein [Thermosipho melanesiensis]ABR30688.1 redox-active disulfide protein 2 [Thermosipho melanesiensis BI429]APT73819.1 redox-active disulfide protein 2 [Thermosipho melanesiensis]OOC35757.1 redox-active disulfide protein 2 [Thermosipho melanesiensis]OOC39056.1 redox-active disulfide protein 2 [Thermosipho melanesiensis]OOC39204.1 redox-active disulfide protein 2 [Thermosipho melanesiensis]